MGYPLVFSRGESRPLGATVRDGGVNFSLYSEHASAVELLLFERFEDVAPRQVIRLESRHHRNFNYWHVFVHGVGHGQLYAYRVFGPWAPEQGHRFNDRKVLIDPYAKGIVYDDRWSRDEAVSDADNIASAMRSLVVDTSQFDWQGVEPPRIDPTERVIYELHVRGFTQDPSAGVDAPGTFGGLIEKIPYLKALGVTTVELLPVFQFDETAPGFEHHITGEPVRDYWGYNPIGFFAPHRGYYAEGWDRMTHLVNFRELVRALHEAGLEVFLDVVFNHTAEAGADGPTMSFRGIENAAYYQLNPRARARYMDYSGCGNTVNCNHPIVRRLILDSLRYWVETMRVDGFRFDLASILSRDEQGRPLETPPLTWEIECDPILQRATLIAEAWDAAGLYQVGAFPGERWSEWNGQYRDDVRRFWRGDPGVAPIMARRLLGSPDLYEDHGRLPTQCVNFICCHDGFTLNDLVSYNRKHNEANGEDNRDGHNDNLSWNYGVEGPTDHPGVEALRVRQIKNFTATLLLSQGTPMLLAGDEFRRTQHGNNNAWCQDNPTGWVDWSRLDAHPEIHDFTRKMLAFRKRHPSLRRDRYLLGVEALDRLDPPGYTRVAWHGQRADAPDWSPRSTTLALTLTESDDDVAIHMMFNTSDEVRTFHPPPPPRGTHWLVAVDTSAEAPHDCAAPGEELPLKGLHVVLAPRSVVVLIQTPGTKPPRGMPW